MTTETTQRSDPRHGASPTAKRVALWAALVALVTVGYGWYTLTQGRVWPSR